MSDTNDPRLSALDCGCDPRVGHKCRDHQDKDVRCDAGHLGRFPWCQACVALKRRGEEGR